jgi:hypothetical protein
MMPLWFWQHEQVPWIAVYDNHGKMVFCIWPWHG